MRWACSGYESQEGPINHIAGISKDTFQHEDGWMEHDPRRRCWTCRPAQRLDTCTSPGVLLTITICNPAQVKGRAARKGQLRTKLSYLAVSLNCRPNCWLVSTGLKIIQNFVVASPCDAQLFWTSSPPAQKHTQLLQQCKHEPRRLSSGCECMLFALVFQPQISAWLLIKL